MLDSSLSQISESIHYSDVFLMLMGEEVRTDLISPTSPEACKARGVPFHPAQREQRQENVYARKSSNVKADT